ncbi:Oxidoreductase probably involved in sulfite reduction [Methylophaga thiooxydans]|uniref:Oxidoreductase probably involved in sulfite reduction n=1 Tax=Methylophaga thiooxydans TaxID=392484 RepID=A0A0A0BFS2_9GAMM|nr:DUF934 domain-containing protein [Methylophaga thiooxydans]KGM06756.1 Oxidoreductase probably involved in sulfite reduction [Methylophaga thiooxydans]
MNNVISLVNSSQPEISEHDNWHLVDAIENSEAILPKSMLVIPFKEWLESPETYTTDPKAFWLDNETDVHLVEPWLDKIELIALNFPKFTDGRAYTQAVELRTQLRWRGELRAFGDVLRDQLTHMHRCGFNSFAVREDKDILDAMKGLNGISTRYSGSAIEPEPLFRRRSVI